MRSPELPAGTGLALAVLLVLVGVAVLGERGGEDGGREPVPPSAAALSVYDGRSPSEPGGREQRVLVELPRPALADRDDLESLSADEQRDYVRSLEREGAALRSALGARGVELGDAVSFGRTWDGFAATIDNSDLASLPSLGVRALPVRRFYPATGEPIPVPGTAATSAEAAPPAGQTPVAILDTGADPDAPLRRGRVAPGFDALDRDADTSPGADVRTPSRRESTGSALAGLVAAAGERVLTIRVAGYGAARQEIHGTTDTLLAGLERAVDPDGDGAVDDAVRVALVGVNAPYAGFADSAEAQAVRGADRLGTLVVAPAGNEGPARPPNGVVGSPGAARTALAAGATEAGAGIPRVAVTIGGRELRGAAVLGGAPPPGSERLAGPVAGTDTAALLRGRVELAGRIALVRAGQNPVAQASAAAGAGARAVLLADPRDRPLPMLPAGRAAAPVIGLTGAAAKAALAAPKDARVRFGKVTVDRPKPGGAAASAAGTPAPFSSRGPAFDGTPKPDALAAGAAVTDVGLVAGTAVAAARVAVRAARLARQRPAETPAGLRSALAPRQAPEARGAPPAPAVPLGPLELTRSGDAVVGVRFALGAFDRGDPLAGGARIEPAARLDLELLDAQGAVQQRLTPPDGARDLLPAEYAYRLPAGALKDLDAGEYRFRATARAPRRDRPRTRRSPAFEVR
ncbi:MAG TPA: S8 family serine peptidase [Solirubrobacteraceae bacterium]|nr:S8 family serine peptidase [Solirubrobacteraceae bacterium]